MEPESPEQRAKRERNRVLFGSVAELYEETRSGYPAELLDALVGTADVRAGDAVLEIGCGTGQLTRQLTPIGVDLTAIDLAPEMVAAATRAVDRPVHFEVVPFEDLDAPDDAFRLIASGTAFHWLDPAVCWTKILRLLAPGGWLAVLETVEKYDDPIGPAILQLWVDRSDDGGAWLDTPRTTPADRIEATGRFEPPLVRAHERRRTMPPHHVLGLELTRATSLAYSPEVRSSFTTDLQRLLEPLDEVALVQWSSLTMARPRLPQS